MNNEKGIAERVATVLFVLLAFSSCYKNDDYVRHCVDCTPHGCPNSKSDMPMINGWPTWCAPAINGTPWCMFSSSSETAVTINKAWAPSISVVGSGIRLHTSLPLTAPVPIAYLGTLSKNYTPHFLYGRVIVPEEMLFDPGSGSYVSAPIWGLPIVGTHLYRLPGMELQVEIDSPPATGQCSDVFGVAVTEEDFRAADRLAVYSGIVTVTVFGGYDLIRIDSFLEDNFLRRQYGGSLSSTTFLYTSWTRPGYSDAVSDPNWHFFTSDREKKKVGSTLAFEVPKYVDLGVVVSNSLCTGLSWEEIKKVLYGKPFTQSTINLNPPFFGPFSPPDRKGLPSEQNPDDLFSKYYNCSLINMEYYY